MGAVAALFRHPVKGFTPEALPAALLEAGRAFPCDRLFAVENGASGFDPDAPVHLPKSRFTVLAQIPALARARTRYDADAGVLHVDAAGAASLAADLGTEAGRAALARWLEAFLPEEDRRGALKVLHAPGAHRFMDDAAGAVSLINLTSVRDIAARLGRPVDPARFRGNIHVEGWAPWAELDLAPGAMVRLGQVEARVVKPIVRCAATHVDPGSGERDLPVVNALFEQYGHRHCGLYLQVAWGGEVTVGDRAEADFAPPAAFPAKEELPAAVRLG